jgi:type IV pilus assembly protein PilX
MEQGVMNTNPVSARPMPSLQSNQRGVVLFIALIVMVAMSLAAVALMRSVDTTTTVIGNLGFRQASALPANYGIEDAASGLFNDANITFLARIPDRRDDFPAENYYASHSQAAGWDDKYGVPLPLQTQPAAAWPRRKQDGAQNVVTYVVERMCNPSAPAAAIPADNSTARGWCEMAPEKDPPGGTANDPSAGYDFRQVYYRVTVRVDGPVGTNAVSFAQAMLR